jgi:hypothetical protein
MSNLSPKYAPERTSADHSEFYRFTPWFAPASAVMPCESGHPVTRDVAVKTPGARHIALPAGLSSGGAAYRISRVRG